MDEHAPPGASRLARSGRGRRRGLLEAAAEGREPDSPVEKAS